MKRAYICSPLRGDYAENIEKAKGYCRETAQNGALPFAAHIYFIQFLDDASPDQRATGMKMGLEWLKLCDEVHVYGNVISEGMAAEIEYAEKLGLPVIYYN